ncbi:MAG: insulinase family protein [Pyrinomonadaceae bacterium]|nr:insulinase family protein [Pyrinomonadaceae bacterium]
MTENLQSRLPAPLAPRAFSLKSFTETVLSNGLKLVVAEDTRLPIVSLRLAFKSGSSLDARELKGLNGTMTAMLNEGTKKRTSQQIALEVENIGASLGASGGADNTVVSASALSTYTNQILELMADIVLNPTFPENELKIQLDNAKQSLIAQRAQPSFLGDELSSKIVFGNHPYGTITATEDSLNRITREKLIEKHAQIFAPNNAVLIVVGDVQTANLTAELEKLFADWKPSEPLTPTFDEPPTYTKRKAYVIDRAGSAQANVVLSNIATKRNTPDYFPILLMNQILGGGASSRLFMNLRESKDLTYGAYSSFDMRKLAGAFDASAEVRSEVVGIALKEFFYEFDRICNESVPDEELQDAKNYLTGVFPIKLETQEGLTNQLLTIQINDLPSDYLQTYRDNINAVTIEDVQRVAQKYILSDKTAIVIVGDAKSVNEQVKDFADEIEFYDTQGNRKELSETSETTLDENILGAWNLKVASPQGELPIILYIKNDGHGTLESAMGNGSLSNISFQNNSLTATADISFQGMPVSLNLEGKIDGDKISGNVVTGIPGIPSLPFDGTKVQQ